jgi:hypothetical protein
MVTELADGHRAVTRGIGSPYIEIVHVATPVRSGTLLELTSRWPPREVRGHAVPRDMPEKMHEAMKQAAEGYQALIERGPASRTPDHGNDGTGIPV